VTGGELSIANGASPIFLSGSITPDDIAVGAQEVEISLELTPANLNDWRTVATGSAAGSNIAGSPVYGSFSIAFANGADTLTIAATRVPFMIDFPDSDAGGGAVTITAVGMPVLPTGGGAPLTVTVVNTVASY